MIGGGPAGLACAYFLRRLGHGVIIFDKMRNLGGMLRYGIPEYRLPKKILEWEIDSILEMGIEYHTGVKLGVDFDLESLISQGYDAIFLGVGAWSDYRLKVKGEDLKGCFTGIDFLTRFAKIQQGDSTDGSKPIGQKCVVIGGGNTAIDCVRTLVRLGAQEVTIVYRRTRNEMPANRVEIEAAKKEGVKFHFLASPVQAIGDKEGRVTHLEYLKMKLGEPDASGRRRPVPIEGSETLIETDMMITAIGQGPDISFADKGKSISDLSVTRWNTIDADPEILQSNIPHIFTAGDAFTGASLVVEAIGGGRRAARAIHFYLSGKKLNPVPKSLLKKHIQESIFDLVSGIIKSPRTKMPELPVEDRIRSFVETDLVISKKEAEFESNRCLDCCRICYNKDAA